MLWLYKKKYESIMKNVYLDLIVWIWDIADQLELIFHIALMVSYSAR